MSAAPHQPTNQGSVKTADGAAICIMVVAAEASGDNLGAGLIRSLRAHLGPRVRFVGVGGAAMAREGVKSPVDISELSILGLWEGLIAYSRVVRCANETAALAAVEKPDAAILIDSWGFTLRVAQRLRRIDPIMPLIKYVGPQVWASRPGRAKVLAKTVDELLSIHAFEASYFEDAGLKTTFVGNSALSRDFSGADPARLRAHIGAAPEDPILLLLPGSRPAEIRRLMPVFQQVAARLAARRPNLRLVLPATETVTDLINASVERWSAPVNVLEGEALKYDAMCAATVALACSGTVTTELALAGCPMVVAYKVGRLTHFILKRLLTTKYATLFNIAAGDAVAPEMLQNDCTPEVLVRVLEARLDDAALRRHQSERQTAALSLMGIGGADPAELAARAVIRSLSTRFPDLAFP